ncbi:LysR substrate-binding domain-containing protein [Kiloniella laminariae]|uniref:LysR substrate-binding domain-containing protein n=1 Tax=Kiloniella laminariae TaxID=454162 RepID=A0ABT4LN32_9PROT|nr:LysR substrate-binding domain-containing protein [Kiloniella laminariae]MCZ4282550.1 LysR substrate-binding domain-containing protein [Kiloniella laminariae]
MNAIRAFEAAARLLSISGAAKELSVTPTAISHQIRQLEDLLNCKLFERSGRNIALTALGESLLPDVTQGMDSLARAFEETYGKVDINTVTLSTTREFARYWLQPRLASFYKQFPEITVNIFTSESCVDLPGTEIDVAVRYGPVPSECAGDMVLFQEHYIPAVKRSLVNSKGKTVHIADMQSKRLIDVRWKNRTLTAPSWKIWFEQSREEDFHHYKRMDFDSYHLALDALQRGHGAALLSQTIVNSDEFASDLVQIDGPHLPGYSYRVIVSPASQRKKNVCLFVDWLLAEKQVIP